MINAGLNGLALIWTLFAVAFTGHLVFKYGWGAKDVAQRNAQFKSLQRHYLIPYLSILLAESIQGPYLYVLYYAYGFIPSQIAVLYATGLVMNVICTVFTVYLLSRYGRKVLCLCCVASGSLACALKYGHEHVLSFDFPKEWLFSSVAILSTTAGFLSVAAGFIAEFAEWMSSVTAFPFFFSVLFQLAGGTYIMKVWPENCLEAEHRINVKQQFTRALGIFKRKPEILVLCSVHTLFESTMLIFIFVWTPLFIHYQTVVPRRLSYGIIYSAFMASALLGSTLSRSFRKIVSPSLSLLGSSLVSLFSLTLVVLIIPTQVDQWTSRKYYMLLFVCCLFETCVGIYLPAMNKLQAEMLPADRRHALLALLRVPLTIISCSGMLFLHAGSTDWQIVAMACVLLLFCTLSAFLLHIAVSRANRNKFNDHFVLQLTTNIPEELDDSDNFSHLADGPGLK
uniref:Molybdate-anion transporter n=1 Tax=Syphacia muris TaxID=451379 RepID=A0A0N5AGM1_9BILA